MKKDEKITLWSERIHEFQSSELFLQALFG